MIYMSDLRVNFTVSYKNMFEFESSGAMRTLGIVCVAVDHMSFQRKGIDGNLWTQETLEWSGGCKMSVFFCVLCQVFARE